MPNLTEFAEWKSFLDVKFSNSLLNEVRTHRVKERMLEDAVLLVLTWRQLSDKSRSNRVTLKQGAEIVGIAKKSLDDYLLQFRLGKKYGFDFKKHAKSKIGILRTYNKDMKKASKVGKFLAGRKRKENEEDYSELVRNIIMEMNTPLLQNLTKEVIQKPQVSSKSIKIESQVITWPQFNNIDIVKSEDPTPSEQIHINDRSKNCEKLHSDMLNLDFQQADYFESLWSEFELTQEQMTRGYSQECLEQTIFDIPFKLFSCDSLHWFE